MEEKKFDIRDFVRKGVDVSDLYNQWEDDRGATGMENVFNLERTGDFIHFVEHYGSREADNYYRAGQYYFNGANYNKPMHISYEFLWQSISEILDLDYFRDAEEKFGRIDYWDAFVDISAIKALLHPAKKKYVIRHHWRQWVDITVEASDLEEAYMKADDLYNAGEYEELPENFENTEVEDVTDIYVKNKLPY